MGTVGPFIHGKAPVRVRRTATVAFAVPFLISAFAVFALAFLVGDLLRLSDLSVELRRVIAAGGLLFLALLDLVAITCSRYCLISWNRQTPRTVMQQRSIVVTNAIWGFDTGLAFTTFRVAAITWGAFILALLGLAGWQLGLGYGVGFVLPLVISLWMDKRVLERPFLQRLIGMRWVAQSASSLLLIASGLILIQMTV